MPEIPLYQVDSFTDRPFAGNPAGVCILDSPAERVWMQLVAREMNVSETAFVHRDGYDYALRWFTPEVEVELCGHATLATAHVLAETGRLAPGARARFHTLSGVLEAAAADGWITLDFPATPASEAEPPAGLVEALGARPVWTGRSRFDVLAELDSEEAVRGLAPDFAALRRVDVRGVIVTARGGDGDCDFVSRFFAPRLGIDEDPVTGSAHCCLTPYWAARLGRESLTARQLSRRGGAMKVTLAGDRVQLAGRAVTVIRGSLLA